MNLPISSLLPSYQDEPYVFRKQLKAKNKYNLPAGEYVVTDLYPVSPMDGDLIYLIVSELTHKTQILSAIFDPETGQAEMSLQHLQSPYALSALAMLNEILQRSMRQAPLQARMDDVFERYMISFGMLLKSDEELFVSG